MQNNYILLRNKGKKIAMKISKEIRIIDMRETLLVSLTKDFFFFLFIGTLIYFSQSTFWTFVCAMVALLVFSAKIVAFVKKRYVEVKTKEELLAACKYFFDDKDH